MLDIFRLVRRRLCCHLQCRMCHRFSFPAGPEPRLQSLEGKLDEIIGKQRRQETTTKVDRQLPQYPYLARHEKQLLPQVQRVGQLAQEVHNGHIQESEPPVSPV